MWRYCHVFWSHTCALQMRQLINMLKTAWKVEGVSNKLSVFVKGPGWEPGKPRLGYIEDIPDVSSALLWLTYCFLCKLWIASMYIVWRLQPNIQILDSYLNIVCIFVLHGLLHFCFRLFVLWSVIKIIISRQGNLKKATSPLQMDVQWYSPAKASVHPT